MAPSVALLAEGVDRNAPAAVGKYRTMVALLAEGVDRNSHITFKDCKFLVALLAEGVDRNAAAFGVLLTASTSPSSRRAWIEMPPTPPAALSHCVALLAEGVDRNQRVLLQSPCALVALLAEGVDRNQPGYLCSHQ